MQKIVNHNFAELYRTQDGYLIKFFDIQKDEPDLLNYTSNLEYVAREFLVLISETEDEMEKAEEPEVVDVFIRRILKEGFVDLTV